MNNNINFGIDLGTTNSLIARFDQGNVEVFKNPFGQKETLPSVVAFRKDRIIVGDKARELTEKDAENVFAAFKRKMGTSESFFVPNLADFRTPVELSAQVLKELKNFIYSGEKPEAVVITIPASFDTIQSNATKKAGYAAGFQEVVLLQEPIAASLAFANKQGAGAALSGQWLAYDLGGGTFDVALVRIVDGEMRVLDHEGDNYLGGVDFDMALIDQVILPYLAQTYQLQDLEQECKSARGKYHTLYYVLLKKAEDVKVQLTGSPVAELEFEFITPDGEEQEVYMTITREQFENCIADKVRYSIDLVKNILARNEVAPGDIQEVVLIGGSTYIPLVKQLLNKELGIPINASVDPTTAVAIGAAYFAGSKGRQVQAAAPVEKPVQQGPPQLHFKAAYQKITQDREEYFTAQVTGPVEDRFFRIVRRDGGFDSGLKVLQNRIAEMLTLVPNTANNFDIFVYDTDNNAVPIDAPVIEITHGKFNVHGQPLPNDICIEVDDITHNTTRLEVIFEKNAILPLHKTITRELVKTITRSGNESLLINVLEGSRYALPASCIPLGVIEISASSLETDLVKGSDIEITLSMSESRDLSIRAVLLMNEQEFSNVFSPSERQVNMGKLKEELELVRRQAEKDMRNFDKQEEYAQAAVARNVLEEVNGMLRRISSIGQDDTTDERYQMEERKRKLSQLLDEATRENKLVEVHERYFEMKHACEQIIASNNDPSRQQRLEKIVANEKSYLSARNTYVVETKTRELRELAWEIRRNQDMTWVMIFMNMQDEPLTTFSDQAKATALFEKGEKALERKNYQELQAICWQINSLMPEHKDPRIKGTGIG